MVELTELANYFAFLCGMVHPFEVPAPPTAINCRAKTGLRRRRAEA
jgi:hypothetical protein